MIETSAPHNWCDRKCERCPLRAECPVGTDTRTMEETFAAAERLLEEVDQSDAPPRPAEVPTAEELTLRDIAYHWATLVEHALRDGRGFLIFGKVARIITEDRFDDPELYAMDTVPNLMLVERVLDGVTRDLGDRVSRFAELDRRLRTMLARHLDAITDDDRAALAALERAGRAPSPFLR